MKSSHRFFLTKRKAPKRINDMTKPAKSVDTKLPGSKLIQVEPDTGWSCDDIGNVRLSSIPNPIQPIHSPPYNCFASRKLPLALYEIRLTEAPMISIATAAMIDLVSSFFISGSSGFWSYGVSYGGLLGSDPPGSFGAPRQCHLAICSIYVP